MLVHKLNAAHVCEVDKDTEANVEQPRVRGMQVLDKQQDEGPHEVVGFHHLHSVGLRFGADDVGEKSREVHDSLVHLARVLLHRFPRRLQHSSRLSGCGSHAVEFRLRFPYPSGRPAASRPRLAFARVIAASSAVDCKELAHMPLHHPRSRVLAYGHLLLIRDPRMYCPRQLGFERLTGLAPPYVGAHDFVVCIIIAVRSVRGRRGDARGVLGGSRHGLDICQGPSSTSHNVLCLIILRLPEKSAQARFSLVKG
mmetsp:Transcript_7205/g.20948  ORF Transcript_7205/g.20948 Transcript_7205/m.20948 type:complete len:254 (+) Transcript_7205:892-1653(+)